MSAALQHLIDNNRKWAGLMSASDPEFFVRLSRQQSPQYLWIGCSDSRVPANEIIGLAPGEVFVHRNIANVVVHSDLNLLAVIQFAVDLLKVRHIILCGHYGCGGVRAAMEGGEHGLSDNWLRHIKDVYRTHQTALDVLPNTQQRFDRLCELNVREQVRNVCHTTLVQSAWGRAQPLTVHGWIYGLRDGIIHDLDVSVQGLAQIDALYRVVGACPEAN